MRYVLDLTAIEQPTLDLTLPEGTKIRVTIPGVDLVREFQATDADLNTLLASGTKDGVTEAYDQLARVLSCNLEGITFTGEELINKYGLKNLYYVAALYGEYKRFINEIEKN